MSLGLCKLCGGPYNDCESCCEKEKRQAIRDAVEDLQGEIATAADLLNTSLREAGAFNQQVTDPYRGLRLRDGIDALVVAYNSRLRKAGK